MVFSCHPQKNYKCCGLIGAATIVGATQVWYAVMTRPSYSEHRKWRIRAGSTKLTVWWVSLADQITFENKIM